MKKERYIKRLRDQLSEGWAKQRRKRQQHKNSKKKTQEEDRQCINKAAQHMT